MVEEAVNELALFAGAGGGLLGSTILGWRTVGACEISSYAREVIMRRQRDGVLDVFPIWDDIRTFEGHAWRGSVDIVTGGFPCQPFSLAGKGRGLQDPRNLWPDTIRVIREVGSRYVFLENVPGLLAHSYFGTILGQLAESGYDARWDCVPASAIGANHRRDRLWIMAVANGAGGGSQDRNSQHERGRPSENRGAGISHATRRQAGTSVSDAGAASEDVADADQERCNQRAGKVFQGEPRAVGGRENASDTTSARLEGRINAETSRTAFGAAGSPSWWITEPDVGRVAHGVARRVDRLKALGNGQVPAVAAAAWRLLNE